MEQVRRDSPIFVARRRCGHITWDIDINQELSTVMTVLAALAHVSGLRGVQHRTTLDVYTSKLLCIGKAQPRTAFEGVVLRSPSRAPSSIHYSLVKWGEVKFDKAGVIGVRVTKRVYKGNISWDYKRWVSPSRCRGVSKVSSRACGSGEATLLHGVTNVAFMPRLQKTLG
jgi:hypothetical protein